jgi:glycosyltransferase involved in cell wall biosynthesis
MKIIVHSSYSAQTISAALGKAEYSYYFVLAGFMPALRQLGDVVMVNDPEAEVDAIFDACQAAGEACVFLCFAPPHQVPITLRCPTIPVVAWEFSTIPCEVWGDDPRCDWRVVFAHCKRVITLSSYTAALVREVMGQDFPVFAIPTATYDAFADPVPVLPVTAARNIHMHGYLFDSAVDPRFSRSPPWPPVPAPHFVPPPVALVSEPEQVPTPHSLRKRVFLTAYYLRAWYRDVLRDLLPGIFKRFASACGGSAHRLYRAAMHKRKVPTLVAPQGVSVVSVYPECEVTLNGVVYVSVLAPQDGRKNWQDMLSGFIWAFRENPEATLFLKMPIHGGVEAYPVMYAILNRFAPFQCRVVFFTGFLDDAEYRGLMRATTYYINTSHAEGLCLPLMEFLSAGIPAVAPDHTAMADYINADIAFILRASLEQNVWPFDPRDLFTTMRYKLNWESLVAAYEQSYKLATTEDAKYAAMCEASREAMRAFCTLDVVQAKLAEALGISVSAPVLHETGMVAA